MRVVGLPRAFYYIARHSPPDLSVQATLRLRLLSCWQALRRQGLTSIEASWELGLPRATLYRWQKRLQAQGLKGLEEESRRPKRLRRPTWSPQLAQAVLELRERHPRWGKDTLVVLLRRQGWQVSTSMVGRILVKLRARGQVRGAPLLDPWHPRPPFRRPYAIRKPRGWLIQAPGDLVQVDTADIRPLPGVAYKHFTARDVVSRWDVLEVYSRATAHTATAFLDALVSRLPFPIKAIQVDGGSEFMAQFERACQEKGIRLFVLPPHSPKLNGHVERAHRTHREEFYQVVDLPDSLEELRERLRAWERTYNGYRPHQALGGRTPLEYLSQCHPELALNLSHMY
ncbi:MAG TPA: integrase core domain-containing protein [Dehalococcoidia bacterium]|nr:integrase core domain-containing protein [Dehalococcoidia bacterium]